jgi:hypothetical protein
MPLPEITANRTANSRPWSFEQAAQWAHLPIHRLPLSHTSNVFGVTYIPVRDSAGGEMWITEHGWRHLEQLEPSRWFSQRQYRRRGIELAGGTGAVYRVPGQDPAGRNASPQAIDLVVKFSRMAQDVPLDVASTFPGDVPRHQLDSATFNNPFREFALLNALRNSRCAKGPARILTKRPLAIYAPAREYKTWQLRRSEDLFRQQARRLELDQALQHPDMIPVTLSIQRQYIALFQWVDGVDAEQLVERGLLSAGESQQLVRDVVNDLAQRGFRVLDTKPNHIILRQRRNGELLRSDGRLVYALVDFELLQRTTNVDRWCRETSSTHSGSTSPLHGETTSPAPFPASC